LRPEIDPFHDVERLSTPTSHVFDKLGNARLGNPRLAGQLHKLARTREEGNDSILDESLNLARWKSKMLAPTIADTPCGCRALVA